MPCDSVCFPKNYCHALGIALKHACICQPPISPPTCFVTPVWNDLSGNRLDAVWKPSGSMTNKRKSSGSRLEARKTRGNRLEVVWNQKNAWKPSGSKKNARNPPGSRLEAVWKPSGSRKMQGNRSGSRLEACTNNSQTCLEAVWTPSGNRQTRGNCLEAVWKPSGSRLEPEESRLEAILEAVWKHDQRAETCPEAVWKLSGNRLEIVWMRRLTPV